VIKEAKTATKGNVADADMVVTLVADYCQNMEMPFFGKDQPGETYYYTPKTINLFGIVDCNSEKEVLHAYGYGEDHGGKGKFNVVSLLIKHLEDLGWLDGTKRKTLNVVMGNCAGQNKTNYVLRLALYLVQKGYFSEVRFIFLVVGHTKNVADGLFNILKKLYRAQNIFSMSMMMKAMKHELTIPYEVDWRVFKNWDKCFLEMSHLWSLVSHISHQGRFCHDQSFLLHDCPKLCISAYDLVAYGPLAIRGMPSVLVAT
jgi:hypothetical protein